MLNYKTLIMFIKYRNSFLKIFSFLMIMSALLLSSQVNAQQLPMQQPPQQVEYSDEELIAFVNVAQQVMPLQQESQMKMIGEIEEENLSVDDFNNILQAQSTGQNVDASQEELEAVNNAMEGIRSIQMEYETIITKAIEDEGMAPAKYEEIITNYQQSPELQMRINALLEDRMEE
jgi:hypothetical protein